MTTRSGAARIRVPTDWAALARELAVQLSAGAAEHDSTDRFVSDNLAMLKARGLYAAGVPEQLGGGGASHAELCDMLRILAAGCGSTALTLAMHTHLVATAAWRWRRDPAPVEPLLRRVASEGLALVTTGGADWLQGTCRAEPTEGGYLVSGRKIFASGVPFGDLMMTCAVLDDAERGPTVLHFALPLGAAGVAIQDNWRTLGMRATGSHDVVLENVFVPGTAISAVRPAGKWHPLFHTIAMIALPLIYAVYLGVAEAARDRAIAIARRRRTDEGLVGSVGEMENELAAARVAHADMVATAASSEPGPATTNRIAIGRTLTGRAAIRTVERALEVAGGAAMFRSAGLERLFRDVQGARYHPMQEKSQLRYSGRLALGLDIDG